MHFGTVPEYVAMMTLRRAAEESHDEGIFNKCELMAGLLLPLLQLIAMSVGVVCQ